VISIIAILNVCDEKTCFVKEKGGKESFLPERLCWKSKKETE
jgi:hypothetical protein